MTVRYYIAEGQIARTFHDRPEDAIDYAVAGPEAILKFLGFELIGTGGNCEAMALSLGDGLELLVACDSRAPCDGWETIDCAVYDADGGENDTMQYWCDADADDLRINSIDDFAADMVEYANQAERAKERARPCCDLSKTG